MVRELAPELSYRDECVIPVANLVWWRGVARDEVWRSALTPYRLPHVAASEARLEHLPKSSHLRRSLV